MEERNFLRPAVSLALLASGIIMAAAGTAWFASPVVRLVWYLAAFLPVGLGVMREAWEYAAKGEVFSEFMLMSVASVGAFVIGEYPEAVAVMLFYCIGEALQDMAVDRARQAVLRRIKPFHQGFRHSRPPGKPAVKFPDQHHAPPVGPSKAGLRPRDAQKLLRKLPIGAGKLKFQLMLQPLRDPKAEPRLEIMIPGNLIIISKTVGTLSNDPRGNLILISPKLFLQHRTAVLLIKPP